MKGIAVLGCKIAHSTGSIISGGEFTITTIPSSKCRLDNKGIYSGTLFITFAGGNAVGCVAGSVAGSATINGSSTNTKVDMQPVVLKGDFGILNALGVSPPPLSVPVVVAGQIEVSTVGQEKGIAN